MAKDTEKLIRQLSLISYLMAERRPVTAPEIRRDVEGYSVMNEDAFARRFYADRSELEALGIVLSVEKPVDGLVEQENYSLPPENFHLPPIEFTDERAGGAARPRCSCSTASSPTPSRCGWRCSRSRGAGRARSTRPSSARSRSGSPAPPAATRSRSAWRRSRPRSSGARRSCSSTTRWSATRSARARVDPYQLLYQGGQFYVVGRSHERDAIRVFRLSRIRGKVGYATKAEHDFQRPDELRPARATRTGSTGSSATPSAPPRSGSQTGSRGRSSGTSAATARSRAADDGDDWLFVTPYANARQLIAWVLGLGEQRPDRSARRSSSPSCASGSRCWSSATPASRRSPTRCPSRRQRPRRARTARAPRVRRRRGRPRRR